MNIASLYEQVTNAIIADLEKGAPIWVQPWKTSRRTRLGFLPANLATRRTYSGINIPILWRAASEGGYADPAWMTFKQARGFDARVRKGQKATFIVFTKKLLLQEDDEERRISMLRSYAVFNVAQIEGLPPQLAQPEETAPPLDDDVQRFIDATRAEIRHGGSRACFIPSLDIIQMPQRGDFSSSESFRATLLHELGHWSGHEKRLNRDLKNRFGSRAYAAEELVAELTSAFLCAHLGVTVELRHASYIDTWIALLREDNRAIFTAASKASQAADFLRSFTAEAQQEEDEHA
jgi:antirestriction protein ArdC